MTLDCKKINLKKGSKGKEVEELQTILKNKGFYQGKIDGDFGDMTTDAVKKLQRSQGNDTDGVFGPKTCNKLNQKKVPENNVNTYTDYKGKKFYMTAIQEAAKTFRTHIKNNKNYPDYLVIKDSEGKQYKLGRTAYMGLFEDVSIFMVKNGRVPNYVTAWSTANNPLVIDYQNNGHNCGPASLSMCLQMMACWITEPTLANQLGTGSNGTDPSALARVSRNLGFDFKQITRNATNVRKAIDEGSPVLMHIDTGVAGGKSCLGFYNNYGHYIMCYGYVKSGNTTYYKIADPTKGFKTCLSTSIDNAMKNRTINYWRLNPI